MSESENYIEREPAVRTIGKEIQNVDYLFKEEDRDKAPTYALLPSGAKANRVLMTGTLVEKEDVGTNGPYWKMTIEDHSGTAVLAFVGEYQPEALSKIQDIEPPEFVVVSAKVDEYRPEDEEDEVIVYLQPEDITTVDRSEKNDAQNECILKTIERLERTEGEYVQQSKEHYDQEVRDEITENIMELLES